MNTIHGTNGTFLFYALFKENKCSVNYLTGSYYQKGLVVNQNIRGTMEQLPFNV
jgi:hypothetical protein